MPYAILARPQERPRQQVPRSTANYLLEPCGTRRFNVYAGVKFANGIPDGRINGELISYTEADSVTAI